MKKGLMITIFILTFYSVFGQQFTDLYGDYLGQPPPGDTPVIFAPGIVSGKTIEHSATVFSADGNEVYWAWRENSYSTLHIGFAKRINNRWTKPETFAPFGDSIHYFDPFLSIDSKKLYFGADINGNTDTWYVEKQNEIWSTPRSLSAVVNNSTGQCQGSLTKDGKIYYLDYRTIENKWSCDIVRSKLINGYYTQPDTLPRIINSSAQDWTPYIASDESYLIFSSARQDKWGDLYICFHDIQTDTWTEAINLGEPVNTKSSESFPSVSPDGKYLFFTRYTDENNDMDVYWVSAKIIDRLREKNSIKK